MENLIKADALCLRSVGYSENDAILTLCAMGKGKITVVAKGVKKPKAKLKFAASPLCFGQYMLAVKGERFVLAGCDLYDSFFGLHQSVDKFYAAYSVLETLDKIVLSEPEDELLSAALESLESLKSGEAGSVIIKFFSQTAEISGFSADPAHCQECGEPLLAGAFLAPDGGFYCEKHGGAGLSVPEDALAALRRALDAAANDGICDKSDAKRALSFFLYYFKITFGFSLRSLEEFIKLY